MLRPRSEVRASSARATRSTLIAAYCDAVSPSTAGDEAAVDDVEELVVPLVLVPVEVAVNHTEPLSTFRDHCCTRRHRRGGPTAPRSCSSFQCGRTARDRGSRRRLTGSIFPVASTG